MDDELVRVVTTMARTMEVLVREVQHLRDDVNRLHIDMARTSDLRDTERWRRFTSAASELGNGVLEDVRSRRVRT